VPQTAPPCSKDGFGSVTRGHLRLEDTGGVLEHLETEGGVEKQKLRAFWTSTSDGTWVRGVGQTQKQASSGAPSRDGAGTDRMYSWTRAKLQKDTPGAVVEPRGRGGVSLHPAVLATVRDGVFAASILSRRFHRNNYYLFQAISALS
jgi:hypothetical protein